MRPSNRAPAAAPAPAAVAVALALALGVVLAGSRSALASTGAGVSANPIELARPAVAGHRYVLPDLRVVNTGTEVSVYRLRVDRLPSASGLSVPPQWVRFDRNDISLGPGAAATVGMELTVPAHTAPGRYGSDLIVATVGRGQVGSAAVGAAAATGLGFSVSAGASGGLPGGPLPWEVAAGVAALAVLAWGWHRSGIRLRVERR